jgi:hypothetical protein
MKLCLEDVLEMKNESKVYVQLKRGSFARYMGFPREEPQNLITIRPMKS